MTDAQIIAPPSTKRYDCYVLSLDNAVVVQSPAYTCFTANRPIPVVDAGSVAISSVADLSEFDDDSASVADPAMYGPFIRHSHPVHRNVYERSWLLADGACGFYAVAAHMQWTRDDLEAVLTPEERVFYDNRTPIEMGMLLALAQRVDLDIHFHVDSMDSDANCTTCHNSVMLIDGHYHATHCRFRYTKPIDDAGRAAAPTDLFSEAPRAPPVSYAHITDALSLLSSAPPPSSSKRRLGSHRRHL
jgi:hypothetical protein